MYIALCQFNPIVGAIQDNARRLIDFAAKAHTLGADLIIAPELALCGYPPKDILFHPEIVTQVHAALDRIASESRIPLLLGAPITREGKTGQGFWNAALLCHNKQWEIVAKKQLLPNYDVFDERRYFEPPLANQIDRPIEVNGLKIGVTICEDAWNDPTFFKHRLYQSDPMFDAIKRGAQILVNIAASPFTLEKPQFREQMLSYIARRHQVPLLMCGQTGANDQLIFDGGSLAIDHLGLTKGRLKPFMEGLLLVDIDSSGMSVRLPAELETPPERFEWMRRALVCGISDYFRKCGLKGAIIGLSGGIDSAVTAALAVQALGAKNVLGVRMPSAFSSSHSLEDAEALAQNLGIELVTIEIEKHVETFREHLGETFLSLGLAVTDVTDQNLQSRVRGLLLMALSNESGKLVLATGNKSEISVGYCTLYGDMCGAIAPLGDVYKTDVWELARHLNLGGEIIPQRSIDKVPSAELKETQTDQDILPPYEELDAILRAYMERPVFVDEIQKNTGFERDKIIRVLKMVHHAEYKRSQAPQILMLSDRVFGQGRRWPIAQAFDPYRM